MTPSLGNYLTRSALKLGNSVIADTALAEACAGAGDLFGQHGPQDWGRAYRSVAAEARRLMVEDFGNEDLRELAVSVPGRLPWMHPKYADYNAPRQPWQEEAAQYVADAERLALELRSVAFYDE